MNKKGNTIFFENAPRITSFAAVCGSKESEGIIGSYADIALSDDMYGESTYEKAECKMLSTAISLAVKKSGYKENEVDVLFSGDLLNQIISASFAARDYNFPFLGVYSACSTMSESMLLAAALYKQRGCGHRKSFRFGGKTVQISSRTRLHAPAAGAVDGYGRRRKSYILGRPRCENSKRHYGKSMRFRGNRRKQYGRGNGSGGGRYAHTTF